MKPSVLDQRQREALRLCAEGRVVFVPPRGMPYGKLVTRGRPGRACPDAIGELRDVGAVELVALDDASSATVRVVPTDLGHEALGYPKEEETS